MNIKKAIIPIFLLLIVIVGAFYLYQRSGEKEVFTETPIEQKSDKLAESETEKHLDEEIANVIKGEEPVPAKRRKKVQERKKAKEIKRQEKREESEKKKIFPPNPEQLKAFNELKKKKKEYSNFFAIWNENTGYIRRLLKYERILTEERYFDPEEIAVNFLKENSRLFSLINEDLSDFKIERKELSTFTRITFHQMYKGVPVFFTGISVEVAHKTGEIVLVSNNYQPDLKDLELSVEPAISREEAIEIAKNEVEKDKKHEFDESKMKVDLYVYPYLPDNPIPVYAKRELSDYHLAWVFYYIGKWHVVVDASNGEVLRKAPLWFG
ncbi:MAG: hypothetical protein D6734_02480 [Candidatus Schekmanbacteria bacterium]|nr:MAG: hypothetical protein D6734_02480 [Candidatus Schekmanbacteria bacterium]